MVRNGEERADEDHGVDWKHCVVGRLLTDKTINFMAFKQIMASVWRPVKGLFQFFHELNAKRVFKGGPWNYQQQPILLHELQPNEKPREVELTRLDLWVQVHDVPNGFMSECVTKDVGTYIGIFLESDPMKKSKSDWVCFNFKYEQLNTFCYFCGIIGHSDHFCRKLFDMPKIPRDKFAYGP
ncbi:hypothetical protein P3X46_018223 [Hevea brasiliensis]|uniref:Zinc knuckle CX2CX4HX4C domain-containing protein n=1 Tax=Hevea brasiliensis TaxID=3981 RepID=A0ABQ9LQ14_HEVBR|nr:hypothetical protein P3X46_018223 [Hevea brasiliensis]